MAQQEWTKLSAKRKDAWTKTYPKASRAYAGGVEKLRRQMGTMDKPEYDLYRATNELRAGVTEARQD